MSRTNRQGQAASQRRQQSHPQPHPQSQLPSSPSVPDSLADNASDRQTATLASTPLSPLPPLSPLHHLYRAIADAGAALNISPARLAEGEALERLEVVARLSVEQLARCDGARAQGWFAALGDDLTLDLRLAGQDPDMPAVAALLRAESDPAGALQAFQAAAQAAGETQGDDISVEARLAVGKSRALALAQEMAAHRSGGIAPSRVAVFYTVAAWNRLLSLANVALLEQAGLNRSDRRTCVVLCDASGYLAGVGLECIGAQLPGSPDWLPVSPAAFRQFIAREQEARRLLSEKGGWPDASRAALAERLLVVARTDGLEVTAERLLALRAALAAVSLAAVVQGSLSDGLTLGFAGVRPATCTLGPADDHAPSAAPSAGEEALARLADWATRRGTVDTLIIARECLARELPSGQQVSLSEVARAAVDALEAAKANFTLFVRGQTDRYFAARQSAQDAVADYAETVRKAVSDLTGDVVDNVYRTVGLLAAVVIAGLIEPASSPLLVLLASVLYSAYIAFVIFFLLRARADRFTLEKSALSARLAGMTELTTTESKRIREPATAADGYFRRYMARTRMIYFVLLALGVVVALVFLVLVILALAHASRG